MPTHYIYIGAYEHEKKTRLDDCSDKELINELQSRGFEVIIDTIQTITIK